VRARPLLLRTGAVVHVVHHDGRVTSCARPQTPGWLIEAGVDDADDAGARWEVPDSHDAEWLCLAGRRPRVLRVGSGSVPVTDEVAGVAERFADAPVAQLRREEQRPVAEEWAALCRACEEAYA
jgi:hypothetical protein